MAETDAAARYGAGQCLSETNAESSRNSRALRVISVTDSVAKRIIRVSVARRAERVAQRVEPRLERPPRTPAIARARPSHLLRAGRAHRPGVLVEAQARVLVVVPAGGEQGAHLAFGVVDQALVD